MKIARNIVSLLVLFSCVIGLFFPALATKTARAQISAGSVVDFLAPTDLNPRVFHVAEPVTGFGLNYVVIKQPGDLLPGAPIYFANASLIGTQTGGGSRTNITYTDPMSGPVGTEIQGAVAASHIATSRFNAIRGLIRRGVDGSGNGFTVAQLQQLDAQIGEIARQEQFARDAATRAIALRTDLNELNRQFAANEITEEQFITQRDALASRAEAERRDAEQKVQFIDRELQNTEATTGVNAVQAGVKAAEAKPTTCVPLTARFSVISCIEEIITVIVAGAIKVAAYFVYFGGLALNWAINATVLNLKTRLDGIPAINAVWETFRDLGNMLFIFIIIYVGIRTILGQGTRVSGLIRNIIIVALFVNFSIFAAKAFIDFTNVFAIRIYEQATMGNTNPNDLSETFMNAMKLQNLYKDPFSADIGDVAGFGAGKILVVGIATCTFFFLAGLTFLGAAIVFLYRFVVLIFLLTFSSLAFVTYAMPGFSKLGDWWKSLLNEAIFAPVWMLFLYANIQVIKALGNSGTGDFISIFKSPTNSATSWQMFDIVMNFFIIIFLLGGSTVIARRLSTRGAAKAEKITGAIRETVGSRIRSAAGAATFGAVGAVSRRYVGGLANTFANNQKLQATASQKGIAGMLARGGQSFAQKTAKSSFDFRSSKIGKATVNKSFGEAQGKGGYEAYVKELKKRAEDNSKRFGVSDDRKYVLDQQVKTAEKSKEKLVNQVNKEKDAIFVNTVVQNQHDIAKKELTRLQNLERESRNKAKEAQLNGNQALAAQYTNTADQFKNDIERQKITITRTESELEREKTRVKDEHRQIDLRYKDQFKPINEALRKAYKQKDIELGISEEDYWKRIVDFAGGETIVSEDGRPVQIPKFKDKKNWDKFKKDNPAEYRAIQKYFEKPENGEIKERKGLEKENKERYANEVVNPDNGGVFTLDRFYRLTLSKAARRAAAAEILKKTKDKSNKDKLYEAFEKAVEENKDTDTPPAPTTPEPEAPPAPAGGGN